MNRYFALSLSFLLFSLLFLPTTSQANNGDVYEVGVKILNVRGDPANNAEIIGKLAEGNKVKVFQEKYGWVQTYYGGQKAWVAAHFLNPVSSEDTINSTTSNKVTVTAQGVNIRSGPGTNHSIVNFASTGDTYSLVETRGDWHNIVLSNGANAWIAAAFTNVGTNSETTTSERSNDSSNEAVKQEDTTNSLAGYTIVIDPGHGGNDPGAIGLGGVYEKDFVTSTATKVEQQLNAAGATVIMTRSGDNYASLEERIRISQSSNTDAFISLHFDSFPIFSINGISTYFYSNGTDNELAQSVHTSLASTISLKDRGVRFGDYRVLRYNDAPSILMELGFISNPDDLAAINTESFQNNVAEAITTGLKNYFHD
ncbi:N-acetylmuramoyl-L-alanine amidase [Virgibacillus sp. C22-A2]|uniref:N-acetylmuramoyl-L-alanine amidase n=1 Tax=Virgibacillus tibetensis TaxID=3042313 RepID=A0ABU6KFZ9_9BACI|nr:N-acetylmuramoyl-L-alanine amidase [Virgibacillus sp. C22-A2]